MISTNQYENIFFTRVSCRSLAVVALAFVLAGDIHAHGNSPATQELQPLDPHAQHKMVATDSDDPHAQHKMMAAASGETTMAKVDLPGGLSMLNRFGEKVNLLEDVIGERVVAINFVYTNCTTVCPVTSSIFSMVQTDIGAQMGAEVALITITVDPARDNPHRMRSFSKNFNPGDGWSWLTGEKASVDKALKSLGAYTPNFEDHPAMVLIGDARHSKWYRLYGFPAPGAIEARMKELLDNRSS
jgi:protein SCO1/2